LEFQGLYCNCPLRTYPEDLTVGVINSRKLSIRAVVVLRASAEEQVLEEFTSRLELPGDYQQKTGIWGALNLLASCRDVCRQKSEIVLPSNKPNVREILWRSVELRNVESHVEDGKAVVTGEILAAVLYSEEEESERLQWYETTVPLECAADCDAAGENCIFKISAAPLSAELEIKPDYDGEERNSCARTRRFGRCPRVAGRRDGTSDRSLTRSRKKPFR